MMIVLMVAFCVLAVLSVVAATVWEMLHHD
jgi:hypothetical protein